MYPEYDYIGKEKITENVEIAFPPQQQNKQPGLEYLMNPLPIAFNPYYVPSNKLKGKVAIITGGDSGIGRSIAILFALEGADIVISYLDEHKDANETKNIITSIGRKCILVPGDISQSNNCNLVVENAINAFGKIDILINNCAVQFIKKSLLDITDKQLETTFKTNVFSYFYMSRAVLPYLRRGSSIINTASITAYKGNEDLLDYSSTKGAIVSFTKSLSSSLIKKGIRVNAVAPGPVWTPLIPSSYSKDEVKTFGTYTSKVPMNRAGQPFEIATSYLFLASDDSRYMSGQILHPNGGEII